jgi:hypothetical protein
MLLTPIDFSRLVSMRRVRYLAVHHMANLVSISNL